MSADPWAPPTTVQRPIAAPRPSRLWPSDPPTGASPGTLLEALAVGVLGAVTLQPELAGAPYLVVGVGILAVALGARRRPLTRAQVGAVVVAVALFALPVVRSAPWLLALSLLGGALVGTLALVGPRTWTGLVVGALSGALAPVRAARWVWCTVVDVRLPGAPSKRLWLVVGATVGLVVLFGALFTAADPAYAALLNRALPNVDPSGALRRVPVLAAVTAAALVAAFLAHRPPSTDALAPPVGAPVRRWEWVVPLAVLDLLFLSFVLVQLAALFGGREHVLATDGLTYADYARQGFWQLLVVTVLTLAVIAIAARTAPRASASDRTVVRVLLALLCLLALAVVASALHRMSLYEQQYGFTRLRLFVSVVELTLGATFLLVLAAGIRLRASWLPRAAVAAAAVALLGLAAVDPDAYIADHDVTRYEQSGRIDVAYLATLSPDAVPALDRLPADLRDCALSGLAPALRSASHPWYDVNLARSRAQRLVTEHPVGNCPTALPAS